MKTMTSQTTQISTGHEAGRQGEVGQPVVPGMTAGEADVAAAPTMTVSAFLARVAAVLRAGLPRQVWLEASVVGVRAGRYGHSLELVDPAAGQSASLRAFLPTAALQAIRTEVGAAFDPVVLVGMTTVVLVQPSFDPRWHLGARVVALARSATASLRRRLVEQAMAALKRENLWDRQRRLPAPHDITRVAVVHPAGAAGWADVAARLARWQAAGVLAVRSHPVPFEGERAAAALVRALAEAAAAGSDVHCPDLLLLVRGGGARESLAALDEEAVARAVCLCPVPVVCGTGHSIDVTLADGCAWRRVDTPTAAAALVTGLVAAAARTAIADRAAIIAATTAAVASAEQRLQATAGQLDADAGRALAAAAAGLAACWSTVRVAAASGRGQLERAGSGAALLFGAVLARVPALLAAIDEQLREAMRDVLARAGRAAGRCDDGAILLAGVRARASTVLEREAADLARLRGDVDRDAIGICTDAAVALSRAALLVEAHDPAATLARGYALVSDPAGRVLTTRTRAAGEPRLVLRFGDGALAAVPEGAADGEPEIREVRAIAAMPASEGRQG